ncbi:hypothetical protein VTN00DRAFT_6486 [Thermoascus crustaceus]|uniref:uncharacterized protein n=1 Tax=Thermoascus crustaceus TaxID=5088 RepID=UPI0037435ECB
MAIPPSQVDKTPTTANQIKEVSEKITKIGKDVGSINETVKSLCSTQEERYLDGQMSQLPGIVQDNRELQCKIKSHISTLVNGMFLLAQLYINSLTDKLRERDIDIALEKMQSREEGLNKAYDDAINRIKNQQAGFSNLAKNVLFWIVCAKRALTTEELIHALAVEYGASSLGMGTLYSHKDMVASCAGLITIDQESRIIRLVHYTTQEYLRRNLWEKFPDIQQDTIAINCLTYLSFDVFAGGYCPTSESLET